MQPHNSNGERATQGNTDGRRDTERSASIGEIRMALQEALDANNGQVRLVPPGRTVDMSASIDGRGGLKA